MAPHLKVLVVVAAADPGVVAAAYFAAVQVGANFVLAWPATAPADETMANFDQSFES